MMLGKEGEKDDVYIGKERRMLVRDGEKEHGK